MAKMNIKSEDRPKVKVECLRLLATLRLDPAKTQMISGFVDTYLRLNPAEEIQFEHELNKIGLREQEKVMEIVTSWMEKGIERGIERETSLILRQLSRRLGTLPPAMESQVRSLPIEQLENLGEALLDFEREADLIDWLEQNQQET